MSTAADHPQGDLPDVPKDKSSVQTARRVLGAARHSSVEHEEVAKNDIVKAGDSATSTQKVPKKNCSIVHDKEWVIMEASNGVKRFVLVKQTGEFKFSKRVRCNVQPLIGSNYGQVYEIRDSMPHAVDGALLPLNIDDFITHGSIEAGHDNRDLVDNSENQKLDMESIAEIKGEAGGAAVIAALVNHSSTFKTKTEFSQAKYLKRKQQKYMLRFRLLECTPFTIARLMFEKHSGKIGNIRWDTVAQMLSYAGELSAQHDDAQRKCVSYSSDCC